MPITEQKQASFQQFLAKQTKIFMNIYILWLLIWGVKWHAHVKFFYLFKHLLPYVQVQAGEI